MKNSSVHIIGGGIIGLCTAWYLNKAGFEVEVIDKQGFTDGASYGNAGMIVPSHFIPLASPGMISKGLKWMFDSKSPFYIRPRLNLELVQWLWTFYRSCSKEHVVRAANSLWELNVLSKELYASFADTEGFDFSFEKKGLLMLYKTTAQEKEELELADKANELGVDANVYNTAQLRKLEPEMNLNVLGGVHFPGDAHLHPVEFMRQLIVQLKSRGVRFKELVEVIDFTTAAGKITQLQTSDNQAITVDNVVIASGAWSGILLRRLGYKMLLEDGKGYSVTLKNFKNKPRIPTILTEAKVAITPMGQDLRIGGTLELSGMSNSINRNRVGGVYESFLKYYNEVSLPPLAEQDIWSGYRPCSPDGLPYIGKYKSLRNLFIGTGHGMMGLSMGPVTGKIVSELIQEKKPSLPIELFNPHRF